MEYKDYKTGEAISREQYIANGLDRGELLIRQECGCIAIEDGTAGAYIVYCYKHDAAQRMYEVLRECRNWLLIAEGMMSIEQEVISARAMITQIVNVLGKADRK